MFSTHRRPRTSPSILTTLAFAALTLSFVSCGSSHDTTPQSAANPEPSAAPLASPEPSLADTTGTAEKIVNFPGGQAAFPPGMSQTSIDRIVSAIRKQQQADTASSLPPAGSSPATQPSATGQPTVAH